MASSVSTDHRNLQVQIMQTPIMIYVFKTKRVPCYNLRNIYNFQIPLWNMVFNDLERISFLNPHILTLLLFDLKVINKWKDEGCPFCL